MSAPRYTVRVLVSKVNEDGTYAGTVDEFSLNEASTNLAAVLAVANRMVEEVEERWLWGVHDPDTCSMCDPNAEAANEDEEEEE